MCAVIILLTTGCTTVKSLRDSVADLDARRNPARVIAAEPPLFTQPPPAIVYTAIAPALDNRIQPPADSTIPVPAINLVGTADAICALVAFEMGFSLFTAVQTLTDISGADGDNAQGARGIDGEGLEAPPEFSVNYLGGDLREFLAHLARVGIRAVKVGNDFFCSGVSDWAITPAPRIASGTLSALLVNEDVAAVRVGGVLVVRGDSAAVRRVVTFLTDISGIPTYAPMEVIAIPVDTDIRLLAEWMTLSGLSGDYQLLNRWLIAPPHVAEAVERYLTARAGGDCVVVEWQLRAAAIDDMLALLDIVVPGVSCAGDVPVSATVDSVLSSPATVGDDDAGIVDDLAVGIVGGDRSSATSTSQTWFVSRKRAAIFARISAPRVGDVYAALERLDPYARPVVVSLLAVSASKTKRASIAGAILSGIPAATATALASGLSVQVPIGTLSAAINGVLVDDKGASVTDIQLTGLIGQPLTVTSGRSVPFDDGAFLDPNAGTTQMRIRRVSLGVGASATVNPAAAGWSVEFDLRLSGPTSDPTAFFEISRAGLIFVPFNGSAVALVLQESNANTNRSLVGVARGESVSDTYIIVSVAAGILQ